MSVLEIDFWLCVRFDDLQQIAFPPNVMAFTPCKMNIEPTAWKKTRRSFPWQVRVDDAGAYELAIGADELRKHVPLSTTKVGLLPPAELTEDQKSQLLDALRKRNGAAS